MASKSIRETPLEQSLFSPWMTAVTIQSVRFMQFTRGPLHGATLWALGLQLCFRAEEVGASVCKLGCPRIIQICFKWQSFNSDHGL